MACSLVQKGFSLFDEPVVVKLLSTPRLCEESIHALSSLIHKLFKIVDLQTCTEETLHFKERSYTKILLVLPDALSASQIKLSRAVEEEIKRHCLEGSVKVLGVCAGAFYLSDKVEYEGLEMDHSRYLTLFDGIAKGPLYVEDETKWKLQAQKVKILATQALGCAVALGGTFFSPKEAQTPSSDFKVLATTLDKDEEKPIALASCKDARGFFSALLLGTHFEFEATEQGLKNLKQFFPSKKGEIEKIQHSLTETKEFRLCAMQGFLQELGFR